MLQQTCQVCGNSMYSLNYCGTELDGSLSSEYCSGCYRGGQFYSSKHHNNVNGVAMSWAVLDSGPVMGRSY